MPERMRRLRRQAVSEPLEVRLLLAASPRPVFRLPLVHAAQFEMTLPRAPVPTRTNASRSGSSHRSLQVQPIAILRNATPMSSPSTGSLTPAQMAHAYGLDQLAQAGLEADGAGQTIAIIDAYGYPTALADLQAFDQQFSLPDPPSFQQVNETGGSSLPGSNSGWNTEEALDIEWAHAIAPKAKIILVACATANTDDLDTGVDWARTQSAAVAVSMSYGLRESLLGSLFVEQSEDTHYVTPTGHAGVTFLAATGDKGAPGTYPAYSPNVVAVGGTTLTLAGGNYSTETGWSGTAGASGGGGGISAYEPRPSYQDTLGAQTPARRAIPDVAMDADPGTGVAVYYNGAWYQYGGTSLSCPMWAGLVAIVDQVRAQAGLASLDGPTQALPALYALSSGDFHDITQGNNGFPAGTGYDLVTGRGSPIADLLVPHLAGFGSISGTVYRDNNSNAAKDSGESALAGTTVVVDSGAALSPSTSVPVSIQHSPTATSSLSATGVGTGVTDVNITFNITYPRNSDLTGSLIGPDGTSVTLFSGLSGTNLANITLDDQAAQALPFGQGPTAGSYIPSGSLAAFNGSSPAGTWTFQVTDSSSHKVGSIDSWSLAITTASYETSVVTDSSGNYSVWAPPGTAALRQNVPVHYVQTSPAGGSAASISVTGGANVSQSFGDFPTVFSDSAGNAAYYVAVDSSSANLQISTGTAPQTPPAYQVPLAALPSLSFNLSGASDVLTVDYVNGPPIPAGGLAFTGGGATGELRIRGQTTGQTFTMTNTQFSLATGPALNFSSAHIVAIFNGTYHYTGDWSTIDILSLNAGASFDWV